MTQKYRSSSLGLLWNIIQPVVTVSIFYFVFSVVFQNKWGLVNESKGDFVIALFTGFLVYNVFFDTVSRAPWMIVGNVNYVKKLVFPLHLLPIIGSIPALINFICTFFVIFVLYVVLHGNFPPITALSILYLVIPVYFLALGVSLIISTIAVYFRDISHVVPLVLQGLVFLSPVLYPLDRVPDGFARTIMEANPLAWPIEQARNALMHGSYPNWSALLAAIVVPLVVCIVGALLFQRLRPGFADVL